MTKNKMDQRIDAFLAKTPEIVTNIKELSFELGNCYMRKKDYSLANKYYEESIDACLKNNNSLLYGSGQANLLVDILILSKQMNLIKKVEMQLEKFYKEPYHDTWPVSFYAFSIAELLRMKKPGFWIEKLLENPKNRDACNLGTVLKAIVSDDEVGFNTSINELLKVHDRRVKYGALRYIPEGFISMDGMALIYLAQRRGFFVRIESQYIALDYFT
jgi:tetratricopeptide (TPR) repeat protein